MNHQIVNIALADLQPHPENPRIEPRLDVVESLAQRMIGGMDPSHALIVRPLNGAYQIISGHHRALAAGQVALSEVPCWVRPMDDAEAYMQLVLCNTQSELHPLEEGKHAAQSGMDLKAYAEQAGKARSTLGFKVCAYRVLASVLHMKHADAQDNWRNLAEIHAAPNWLWKALVAEMLEQSWTVAITRKRVANVKDAKAPPEWTNQEAIASAFVAGQVTLTALNAFARIIPEAGVRNDDADKLLDTLLANLKKAKPETLSAAQQIAASATSEQARRDSAKRAVEIAKQRAGEEAQARIVNLRKNCSLDEWHSLSPDEQQLLLVPVPGAGGSFNAQKNEAIEWAQWSWNPVTGCKHDCPYCYARDIALGARMQQASLYPNGWEPTLRSNSLGTPESMRVPPQAQTDTRYRNVFTCSMADLFGRWVPASWIEAVMATVRDSQEWNFLFLTKFPQRLAECEIPDNAWMGTTVDLQARVASAEKAFAKMGGKIKWLSVEPMLEPLHFEHLELFDWVVIGGSSKSEQTPEWHPPYRWIESLVRQCDDAKVPVYMKTNLGIANRLLQLPFNAPLVQPPQVAPEVFHYLGKKSDKAS